MSSLGCDDLGQLQGLSAVAANAGSEAMPSAGTPYAALIDCWASIEQRHADLACPTPLP